MKYQRLNISGAASTFVVLSLLGFRADAQEPAQRHEVERTTEKEMVVVLSSSFGNVIVYKGDPSRMFLVESDTPGGADPRISSDYSIRNRTGYLDLSLGETQHEDQQGKHGFRISSFDHGKWSLALTDAIPVSFDIQLGVGKGEFDLTGLHVKDFNLSTGASEVSLTFSEPNQTTIENMNIESGLSSFIGKNLGNANFRHFRFQGGVGSYTLDFGGSIVSDVSVDIEVGVGAMKVIIPREVGTKIFYEKSWVTRLDCDQDFSESGEGQYISDNYDSAPGKMTLHIDSGFGSIKIIHR